MARLNELAESGALGIGTSLLAKNPEMLRGFGVLGNLAANKLEDKEKDKAKMALMGQKPPENMKKGGKVKKMKSGGYVRSADGCAQRGKTKGRFV